VAVVAAHASEIALMILMPDCPALNYWRGSSAWLLMGFGILAGLLAGLVIAALRYLPAVGHS
jgi:hypothetical protein